MKNLPVMQESPLRSLGRECPLEEGMATLSSILALKILSFKKKNGGYVLFQELPHQLSVEFLSKFVFKKTDDHMLLELNKVRCLHSP